MQDTCIAADAILRNVPMVSRDELRSAIADKPAHTFGVSCRDRTDEQVFSGRSHRHPRDPLAPARSTAAPRLEREVHYLSMEFLMGRSLMKDAFNLTASATRSPVRSRILARSAADILRPSRTQGWQRRPTALPHAATDSLATEGILATGYSPKRGIFRQRIVDGRQTEVVIGGARVP